MVVMAIFLQLRHLVILFTSLIKSADLAGISTGEPLSNARHGLKNKQAKQLKYLSIKAAWPI